MLNNIYSFKLIIEIIIISIRNNRYALKVKYCKEIFRVNDNLYIFAL